MILFWWSNMWRTKSNKLFDSKFLIWFCVIRLIGWSIPKQMVQGRHAARTAHWTILTRYPSKGDQRRKKETETAPFTICAHYSEATTTPTGGQPQGNTPPSPKDLHPDDICNYILTKHLCAEIVDIQTTHVKIENLIIRQI